MAARPAATPTGSPPADTGWSWSIRSSCTCATRALAGRPPRFAVRRGDARTLPFAAGAFDAVLLLGPLYHLGEAAQRAAALAEAVRVCRPGGLVFAAAISRFAPLLDGIHRGDVLDAEVFANVVSELGRGRRVPPPQRRSPFPDAYFHRPDELRRELEAAGLVIEGVYGIEGPGWLLPGLERAWRDAAVRERLLRAACAVETDPDLLGVSLHLLAVGRRPGSAAARRSALPPY